MSAAGDAMSAGTTHVRVNLVEYSLLAVALAALGFTMYETVQVGRAGGGARDLTFSGATTELARTLSTNGTDRIGKLVRATIAIGADTVTVDTIAVVADSVAEPAFAAGGFVRDQIALFNDDAIRRAVLSARSNDAASDAPENRSVLRTALRDDGTRVLSEQPNLTALVVRSPHDEDAWRDVRTVDWRTGPALLGYDTDVPLTGDLRTERTPVRLNGRECTLDRDAPQYYMYCGSALAAEAERFYDFDFEVAPTQQGDAFRSAGPYRQRSIWMNGQSASFGRRAVHGGDVFDVPSLGPFVLSSAEWGTLATGQWINGRRSFANPTAGTLGFFAPVGRTTTPAAAADPIVLSFDEALTSDLAREARHFMAAHPHLLSRLAVVLVDVRTGEVKSIVEPARRSDAEPLLSFEPILVGSTVKPIMASAILARRPSLASLRIPYAGDTVTTVAGVRLNKGFANEANGCSGEIGFDDFLRCSSNDYAAELLVRSLEADGWTSRAPGAVVPRSILERSSIATGLADLFDVDAYGKRTSGRLALYWTVDSSAFAGASAMTTDRSLLPYESRPWILFPDSSGTRIDWLARYAFGGWENRWTLLGLSQAYSRIATGRNVQVTFLHRANAASTAPVFPSASASAADAFARVRAALREVPESGTAAGLAARLQSAVHDSVVVLAKTGTLNESGTGGRLKSLVIAVGRPQGETKNSAIACGLVAVTYFEFADSPRANAERPTLPRIHRDFAEGPLAAVLSRQWSRVSGCENTPPAAPATSRRVSRR